MKHVFYFFIFIVFLIGMGLSCKQADKPREQDLVKQAPINDSVFPDAKIQIPDSNTEKGNGKYGVEILKNKDNSFGYSIKLDSKKLIDQPFIPARQGIHGFRNPEDALKVAGLMVRKMKLGMIPPAVTEAELDSLQIP